MATPNETVETPAASVFDIQTATAVVALYDGSSDGLQAFSVV